MENMGSQHTVDINDYGNGSGSYIPMEDIDYAATNVKQKQQVIESYVDKRFEKGLKQNNKKEKVQPRAHGRGRKAPPKEKSLPKRKAGRGYGGRNA